MFFDTPVASVHAGDETGLINGFTFQGDMKLKSAGTYFMISQANFIKARYRDQFQLITGGNAGTGINPEAPGFFPIDIRYDGKLSTGIPTGALDANLQLLVNENYTSGNTVMYVQRESVRPLAVGA